MFTTKYMKTQPKKVKRYENGGKVVDDGGRSKGENGSSGSGRMLDAQGIADEGDTSGGIQRSDTTKSIIAQPDDEDYGTPKAWERYAMTPGHSDLPTRNNPGATTPKSRK